MSDNKIQILRPVTEQKSRIPVSNSSFELNDSSFFILGSVRNVSGKKTAEKSYCRTHKHIGVNKTQSKESTLKIAQSFTREKSLPAKIEDELEKAKIRAQ